MQRLHLIHLTMIIPIAIGTLVVYGQTPSAARQSASIAVKVALEKDRVSVGGKARAIVTIRNISPQETCFSTASHLYRVHVEGKDGEPPKTEFHRHLHGDFRPGDGPDLDDGPVVCPEIAPGASIFRIYDLAMFYDLTAPGKYTVYLEILDESSGLVGSGIWLRTNTAQFEIMPLAQ